MGCERSRPVPSGGRRVFPELGEYFRRQRESRRMSQRELALRSLETEFPVDQSYISRLERGEVSGSVGKFFSVLLLTNSSSTSVAELLRAGREMARDADALSTEQLLLRARQREEEGQFSEALSWALAGLDKAREEGRDEEQAAALLTASIIFSDMGSWETARALAFQALNLEVAGRAGTLLRKRSILQAAGCCLDMGESVTALLLMESMTQETFGDCPGIGARSWHMLGLAQSAGDRLEDALESFEKARRFYARAPSPSDEARLLAKRARLELELGRSADAVASIAQALTKMEAAGHAVTRVRVLLHAGRVDTLTGRSRLAHKWLVQAERLAEQLGHQEYLFEARLWRYDLALREDDARSAALFRRLLRKQVRRLKLSAEIARSYGEIVESSARKGARR